MRGRNLYSLPKLFIGGKRISEFSSASLSFPGNNQINTLNVSIGDPEYQDAHLFNSKIHFYITFKVGFSLFCLIFKLQI